MRRLCGVWGPDSPLGGIKSPLTASESDAAFRWHTSATSSQFLLNYHTRQTFNPSSRVAEQFVLTGSATGGWMDVAIAVQLFASLCIYCIYLFIISPPPARHQRQHRCRCPITRPTPPLLGVHFIILTHHRHP